MRPIVHFTAESGWINDPHGITYRDGRYHVFYQYVPQSTRWAPNCHWGYATGTDLLTLTEHGIAIAPGEGDDGIWTGSLVTGDDGTDRIFYTSTVAPDYGIGRVRVATPRGDDWSGWTKGAVVAEAPADLDVIAYRDPFVRRENDGWRMFLGAALRDGRATALSYTSSDLETWDYEGIALQRSTTETAPVWMGALWECPQIFEIDGRAVMVSSVWDDDVLHHAGYAIGSYTDGRFEAEHWGRLTYGDSYYAPSLFQDDQGRPSLLFWMRGIADVDAGWASAHSVPYLLGLDGDRLTATPHPDVAAHRGGRVEGGVVRGPAADIVWWDGEGGCLAVDTGSASAAAVEWVDGELVVSVGDQPALRMPAAAPVRVIVDGPVLEVASDGGILGARIDGTDDRIRVTASAGSIDVHPLG